MPIHPLLVAAYPVVFLFATNATEQVTLAPMWSPLVMALGGALIALAIGVVITRSWHRGALIATVLVAGFFGYGHAWNAAVAVLDSQWLLIGAWVLLVLIGLVVAWRFRRRARTRDSRPEPGCRHRAAAQRLDAGRHDGCRGVGRDDPGAI